MSRAQLARDLIESGLLDECLVDYQAQLFQRWIALSNGEEDLTLQPQARGSLEFTNYIKRRLEQMADGR